MGDQTVDVNFVIKAENYFLVATLVSFCSHSELAFKPNFIIKPFFKICQGGQKDHFTVYNTQLSRVSCLMTSGEVYLRVLYTCTYAVVNDRWGATDVVTLSLHFILFPAFLPAWQNFNPVHSAMLFSQRFICRPLLLPPCTVPCKIALASPDDLDTCPNYFRVLQVSIKDVNVLFRWAEAHLTLFKGTPIKANKKSEK